MKVFISWSGELSHKVALCLRDWLPNVVQTLNPYVSSEDIDKGARWSQDIAGELSGSSFGILCVTNSNVDAPWLNFEAGALSRSIESSYVSPFLIDIRKVDVRGPIVQFQFTTFDKEDVKKLVVSLNKADTDSRVDDSRIPHIFDRWWPDLKTQLDNLIKTYDDNSKKPAPSVEQEIDRNTAMIEEILQISRHNTKLISNYEKLTIDSMNRNRSDELLRHHKYDGPIFDLDKRWGNLLNYMESSIPSEFKTEELADRIRKMTEVISYIVRSTARI